MAAHLNRKRVPLWCSLALTAAVCAAPAPAAAQGLADPTQPPASMDALVAGGASEGGPVLQSILISPQRRVAVIDGETVKAGDIIGDARVVRITETEVVLQAGDDMRRLRIYPDVEKTSAAAGDVARGGIAKKHKQ
jgi:MSHA biogenesis protein MshK